MSSPDLNLLGIMAYFKQGNGHKCLILGHQERLNTNPVPAIQAALGLLANGEKICQMYVASCSSDPGYGLIAAPDYYQPLEADGVVLTERDSAVIMQTADCPTVILTNKKSGRKVVVHAGRAALTPHSVGDRENTTIIETALTALNARDLSEVVVLVVGDICGYCFKHDAPEARHLIEPFLMFGDEVFFDRDHFGLSLFMVIEIRLIAAGVPRGNITHANECTYEKGRYASHRRDGDRNDRNHVIVVKTT